MEDSIILPENLYFESTGTTIVPSNQGAILFKAKGTVLTRGEAIKYNLLYFFGSNLDNPAEDKLDVSGLKIELCVEDICVLLDRNIITIPEARAVLGLSIK